MPCIWSWGRPCANMRWMESSRVVSTTFWVSPLQLPYTLKAVLLLEFVSWQLQTLQRAILDERLAMYIGQELKSESSR